MKIDLEEALKLNGVKEFHGFYEDLKNIWKN